MPETLQERTNWVVSAYSAQQLANQIDLESKKLSQAVLLSIDSQSLARRKTIVAINRRLDSYKKRLLILIYRAYKKDFRGKFKSYQDLFRNLVASGNFGKLELQGVSTQIVKSAIESSFLDVKEGLDNGITDLKTELRRTQQTVITETQILKDIGETALTNNTIQNTTNALKNRFGDQKYITIKGRNYDVGKYVELVARTKTRELQTQTARQMALDNGIELVRVSSHTGASDICKPYEGLVLAVRPTGAHPTLSTSNSPPYHPNCRHVIYPYVTEAVA